MNRIGSRKHLSWATALAILSVLATSLVSGTGREAKAGWLNWGKRSSESCCASAADGPRINEVGGSWYWLRSPDEEKRLVAGLYNRYCIRCHGVDGRGVWDIPDVPNFANPSWQASRTEGQLARSVLEGRGAVMPRFRGTLSLEESWAMARYLRTFVPGIEMSRPDFNPPTKTGAVPQAPVPMK